MAYHGDLEKKAAMEKQRGAAEVSDNLKGECLIAKQFLYTCIHIYINFIYKVQYIQNNDQYKVEYSHNMIL